MTLQFLVRVFPAYGRRLTDGREVGYHRLGLGSRQRCPRVALRRWWGHAADAPAAIVALVVGDVRRRQHLLRSGLENHRHQRQGGRLQVLRQRGAVSPVAAVAVFGHDEVRYGDDGQPDHIARLTNQLDHLLVADLAYVVIVNLSGGGKCDLNVSEGSSSFAIT